MLVADVPIYDRIGVGYTATRGPDPRIAARIDRALGDARSVVNVGAGTGSYEPPDREVFAVEPSEVMRAQRPPGAAPVVDACAEDLPLADDSVDAAMSSLAIHHFEDPVRACAEMRRVARRRIVLFTYDPASIGSFWLTDDYFPEFAVEHESYFPLLESQFEWLGPTTRAETIPIPHDCADGFLCAYYRRPAAYLDPVVRAGISPFARRSEAEVADGLARLAADLESGEWAARNAELLEEDEHDFGYRLLITEL